MLLEAAKKDFEERYGKPDVPGTAPDRLSMHARAASQSQGARDGARSVPRVVGLVGLPRVVGRVGLGGGDEERWPGMFS